MANFPVSETMVKFLKNIVKLNSSVVIEEGKEQRFANPTKTVIMSASLPEAWPEVSGLYTLPSFLGVLSSFQQPVIEFDEQELVISGSSGTKVRYRLSQLNLIPRVPLDKKFKTDNPAVEFMLTEHMLNHMGKLTSTLDLDRVKFSVSGGTVNLKAFNSEDPSSHEYTYEVPESDTFVHDSDFLTDVTISLEYLELFMPGSYKVAVSSWGYAVFTKDGDDAVSYLVSLIPPAK